jgi:hypothetical protein
MGTPWPLDEKTEDDRLIKFLYCQFLLYVTKMVIDILIFLPILGKGTFFARTCESSNHFALGITILGFPLSRSRKKTARSNKLAEYPINH